MSDSKVIKDAVRERYAEAARRVRDGKRSCCGASASPSDCSGISSGIYSTDQLTGLPVEALGASLGCGNPTVRAELKPGEVVLDLGSGGGIDVLLSARCVAPAGKAYGLDMTGEMLALARENKKKAGIENAEFLEGEIEDIPLPDRSVDVVISNCVVNLSADKERVFLEIFRVLKPGGRLAISDVVFRGEVPDEIRRSMELWAGCVAGALEESEYRSKLAAAGFEAIEIEPAQIYSAADVRQFLAGSGIDADAVGPVIDGKVMSAMVRARKPSSAGD